MDRVPSFDKIGVTPVPDWQNAAPSAGIPGSIFNVEAINALQHEVVNAIAGSGLAPDASNVSQLLAAIQRIAVGAFGATEGVKLASGAFSLDVPGLNEEDALSATDLISFYQTVVEGGQAAGHHRKTTTAALASYMISFLASITTSNPLPNIVAITGMSGVYVRAVLNNGYIVTQGVASAQVTNGVFEFTLPEAFPDARFTCQLTDQNNSSVGCLITGVPSSGGVFKGFVTALYNNNAPFNGTIAFSYSASGHATAG